MTVWASLLTVLVAGWWIGVGARENVQAGVRATSDIAVIDARARTQVCRAEEGRTESLSQITDTMTALIEAAAARRAR